MLICIHHQLYIYPKSKEEFKCNYSSLLVLVLCAIQVNAVVFSPDEKHFATCSEDGSVRVWSVSSIELVVQFQVLSQVRESTPMFKPNIQKVLCNGAI